MPEGMWWDVDVFEGDDTRQLLLASGSNRRTLELISELNVKRAALVGECASRENYYCGLSTEEITRAQSIVTCEMEKLAATLVPFSPDNIRTWVYTGSQ